MPAGTGFGCQAGVKSGFGPLVKKTLQLVFLVLQLRTSVPPEVLHTDRACFIAHPSKNKVLCNIQCCTRLCEPDLSLSCSEEPSVCWVKSCRSGRAASSSSQAHVVSHSFSKAVSLQDKRGDSQMSQGGVLAKGLGNCPLCLQIMQSPGPCS